MGRCNDACGMARALVVARWSVLCTLLCGEIAIFKLEKKTPGGQGWLIAGVREKYPGNTQAKVRKKHLGVIDSTAVPVAFLKFATVVTISRDVLSCA